VELALSDPEADALERRAASHSAIGIRSQSITYTGSVSARFFPDDQLVAPRDVTSAPRIACLRAGVSIREYEPVTEVMPDGAGVRTTHGEYRDGEGVLIAAGAWSSKLRTDLPVTMPVRGHLIAYDTDRPLIGPILRHKHTYLLQRRTGALIAGSSTEYVEFDREIDRGIVGDIHARASKLLPQLGALTPAESWNGFRPGTEDGNPVVGRLDGTSIWMAFGHYRNGILLAPETARIIAESIG